MLCCMLCVTRNVSADEKILFKAHDVDEHNRVHATHAEDHREHDKAIEAMEAAERAAAERLSQVVADQIVTRVSLALRNRD